MRLYSVLGACTLFISSVMGITITSPPQGASIPAEGIKQITWSFVNTDPSQMDIRCTFPDLPFNGTLIASAVTVTLGLLTFSQPLPVGNNARIQCTHVNNPTALLAESGPINILGGSNPFSATDSASTVTGQVSVFSVPANSEPFPVTTITNALLTSSFDTLATVISSAVTSVSTASVLTTTTTRFSSLVGVTSVGTILLPPENTETSTESGNFESPTILLDDIPDKLSPSLFPSPTSQDPPTIPQFLPLNSPAQIPLVTVPSYIAVASFSKWKRVADASSVSLAAITITGTRGLSSSSSRSSPSSSSIISPATTISGTTTTAPATTFTTTPTPISTFTPPPVTVTLPPSIVTVPPTIITVTPTPKQNFTAPSSHIVPPVIITSILPPPSPFTTFTTQPFTPRPNNSTSIPNVPIETQCAICSSGLINAGNTLLRRKEFLGWICWIGMTAAMMLTGLPF